MKLLYQTARADDGAEIRYVDVGSGAPLLYVVGFGDSIATANALIGRFSENFRCVIFDHRGCGASPSAPDAGVERSARDLRNLLETLDLRDVSLVGFSMGGTVSLSYLERFGTDRIARVVLADVAPKLLNEGDWKLGLWQGRYRRADLERDLTAIVEDSPTFRTSFFVRAATKSRPDETLVFPTDRDGWLEKVVETTGLRPALAKRVFFTERSDDEKRLDRRYWESMCVADFRPTLRKIDVPTLLLFANPGSFYSPLTAEYMAREMGDGATIAEIPDASHAECPKEKGAEFARLITEFCLRK